MNFRVGQKVVCVDAGEDDLGVWMADVPVEGAVYTIKRFREFPEGIGLRLAEIKNTDEWHGCYNSRRFRPVVERKTDISIFTKLLNPSEIEKARKDLERAQ